MPFRLIIEKLEHGNRSLTNAYDRCDTQILESSNVCCFVWCINLSTDRDRRTELKKVSEKDSESYPVGTTYRSTL